VKPTAGHSQPQTGSSGEGRHEQAAPQQLLAGGIDDCHAGRRRQHRRVGVAELGRQLGAGGTQRRDQQGCDGQPPGAGQRPGGLAQQRADPVPAEQTEGSR
jgi:hypothetical protein